MKYEDVERAANELLQEGLKITIKSIRERLGGGSNRDIIPLLKHWKEEHKEAVFGDEFELPDAVIKAVRDFVEKEKKDAIERLQRENGYLKEDIKQLEDDLKVKGIAEQEALSQLVAARDLVVKSEAKSEEYKSIIAKLDASLGQSQERVGELERELAGQKAMLSATEELKQENAELKRENKRLVERAAALEAQLAAERDMRKELLAALGDKGP